MDLAGNIPNIDIVDQIDVSQILGLTDPTNNMEQFWRESARARKPTHPNNPRKKAS